MAAGRRPGRDAEKRAEKKADSKRGLKGKAKKAASAGPVARFFKLVLLLALMAFLGFAGVLILDVGSTVIGGFRFGDITFAHLFDKIGDRVFDRDVPEPKKKATKAAPVRAAAKPKPTTPSTSTPEPERAPTTAPSPEDYAKHVEPTRDPEVEQAKERLNELLRF